MNRSIVDRLLACATVVGIGALLLVGAAFRPPAAGRWTIVAAPKDNATLNSLGIVSPKDIWAAGYRYDPSRAAYDPATYHWDGTKWSTVDARIASSGYDAFNGIGAAAHDDVWAVGYWTPAYYTTAYHPLIEHFDGSSWHVVRVKEGPSLDAGTLNAVAVIDRGDAWAVGYTDGYHALIAHWDGAAWTLAGPLGNRLAELYAVKALSSTNVWAAGNISDGTGKVQPLLMHWDGSRWSVAATPRAKRKNNVLNGIAFTATGSVGFAVGVQSEPYKRRPIPYKALAEDWDGRTWSEGQTDGIPWAFLYGVCVDHAGDAWAVGYRGDAGPAPLFERWTGGAWQQQNVLPAHANGVITAIADDGTSTWAVGWSNAQIGGALILRR